MDFPIRSLPELLSLDGEQFVQAAYEVVLGRTADADGSAYYTARLRNGYSKLSVLSQLGRSGEPYDFSDVPGLRQAVSRYRTGRLPLIGWLFRSLWRVEGETVPERLQRTIISELAELRSDIRSRPLEAASAAGQGRGQANEARISGSGHRRNLVAEQLSPRAREIFDRLTAG